MKWYISIPVIILSMVLIRGLASMDADTQGDQSARIHERMAGREYASLPAACNPPECIMTHPIQNPYDRAHPIPASSYDPKLLANTGGKPNHLPPHILPARALAGGQ